MLPRFLEPISESISVFPMILISGLLVLAIVLLYHLIRPWFSDDRSSPPSLIDGIPNTIRLQVRPLMNQQEVIVFNLIQMVVRDHYLVFAKVPFSKLMFVRTQDSGDRLTFAQAIRNILVDCVLVHPGTRRPVKIIMLHSEEQQGRVSPMREEIMAEIVQELEIEMINLNASMTYSPEALTRILLPEEEQ